METQIRCPWCGDNPLYVQYHDEEWGIPVRDDRTLFEFLVLESAQAGLSWLTILKRREGYRKAYKDFSPEAIALFNEEDIQRLMNDPGIIRNRRKIEASIKNAQSFLEIQKEFGSFSKYIWGFVQNSPIINKWDSLEEIPVETELSRSISKDLKKRGFGFLGPVIIYAYLQATGLVNDHLKSCFRYAST